MEWTTAKPTEEGYYWVEWKGGRLLIVKFSTSFGSDFFTMSGNDDVFEADAFKAFLGPIPEPVR